MGLTIFYLVLLALTRHLGFAWAYLVAALASGVPSTWLLPQPCAGQGRVRGLGSPPCSGWSTPYCSGCCRLRGDSLLLGALLLFATLALVVRADPQARLVSGDE